MKTSLLVIALIIITFFVLPNILRASAATDISQNDFIALQKSKADFVLLDVRSAEEYAQGHIKGAVNISHSEISRRMNELPVDKDIIMYCRSGRRVGVAANILAKNGFSKLFHISGDMNNWVNNKKPVTKK